jgi:hypothetical protein
VTGLGDFDRYMHSMAVSSSFRVRLMSKVLIWSVRQPLPSVCLLPKRSDDLAVGSNIDLAQCMRCKCQPNLLSWFASNVQSDDTYVQYPHASSNTPKSQTPPSLSLCPSPQPALDRQRCADIDRNQPKSHNIKAATKPSHHPRTRAIPEPAKRNPARMVKLKPAPTGRPLTGRPVALLSAHTTGAPLRPPVAESRVFVSDEDTLLWCVSSLAVCREGCVCAGRGSGGGDWLRAWCC